MLASYPTLRSLVFNIAFYVMTAAFLVGATPLLLGSRRGAMHAFNAWARTIIWLQRAIVGTRLEIRGHERMAEGPLLVAIKHQSAWDTIALATLFEDPAYVLKAELLRIPLYGWFARKFGMIAIPRERGTAALRHMLREARARASQGRQILVFPEGTRRPPGAPPAYKRGIVSLYEALDIPCQPVALNSGLFWPRRRFTRYPGTIVVEFLDPIPPGLDRSTFMARLEESIETASNRLLAEAAARPDAPPLPPEAEARLAAMAGQ